MLYSRIRQTAKLISEYRLLYRALLQKRPMILRSLLIVAKLNSTVQIQIRLDTEASEFSGLADFEDVWGGYE